MADYKQAFKITVFGNEGFYNPGKGEAETYMGLDRSQHPKSPIWPIIDRYKANHPTVTQMNALLAKDITVQAVILAFYKTDFWDTLYLDNVNDQQLANNLFDCLINPCIDSPGRVLQKACNQVHPGFGVINGIVGPVTIGYMNNLPAHAVYDAVNAIRAANYKLRIIKSPAMKQWLPIWLKRLVPYKQ